MFNFKIKKLFGFFAVFALILTSLTDASLAGSHSKKKKKSYADGTCDPVQVVIHASYGGGTDTTARMMSIRTRRELGHTFSTRRIDRKVASRPTNTSSDIATSLGVCRGMRVMFPAFWSLSTLRAIDTGRSSY